MAVPPAGTVTMRGFAPLTVQFEATPESADIEWSPADSPVMRSTPRTITFS